MNILSVGMSFTQLTFVIGQFLTWNNSVFTKHLKWWSWACIHIMIHLTTKYGNVKEL